jgi:hypothetical protein
MSMTRAMYSNMPPETPLKVPCRYRQCHTM